MNYKYSGKEYRLDLNDDGKVECKEMNVVADTVDLAKEAIRAQIEVEKSLPRVGVLFVDDWRGDRASYVVGTSTLKNAGRNYYAQIWIAWKDGNKSKREKKSVSDVYLDTPENRAVMDEYVRLMKQAAGLERQAMDMKDELEHVKEIDV